MTPVKSVHVTNSKYTPICKTWTLVLQIVHAKSLITTEGVACELRPLPHGQLWPSAAMTASTDKLLREMKSRGLVRQAHPWTPGKLWAMTPFGEEIIAAIKLALQPKRFKTYAQHRRASKRRRARARVDGRCVNENNRGTHGQATHGCRCLACHETHKRSW